MSEEQQQAPADIEQYEEVYADIPQWPKVVGIISIVLASLGGCCLVGQIVRLALQGAGVGGQERVPEELQKQLDAISMGPASMIAMGLGAVAVAVLMTAGITTVGRKSVGRVLHLVYGGIGIVNVTLSMYISSQIYSRFADYIQQNPSSDLAKAGGLILGVTKISMGIGVLIGGAYPLFTLIWFGLVKRTHESMTGIPDDAASPEDPKAA